MGRVRGSVGRVGSVVATSLVLALAVGHGAPPATATPSQAAVETSSCQILDVIAATSGAGPTRIVVLKTSPASFRIGSVPTSWWTRPPVTTPVWLMYFRGLLWTAQVARDAAQVGDTSTIDALVRTAVASVAANPDPGTSAAGWDEGTNLRRQQSLNCLYRVSGGDPRLVPAIEATAKANLDPTRYYGLPRKGVHNHGLMANLALLDAGTLLDRPLWATTATQRMVRDSAASWTPKGFTVEQSSWYMDHNIALWDTAADAVAANADPVIAAKAAGIRANTTRARGALAHLTSPTGDLIPYGDGSLVRRPVVPQSATVVRDDVAGVLAGRWSWTDPRSGYYLLRYGPPRQQHGHQDRTALVWYTDGVPVLVDPGTYTYDPHPFGTYGRSTAAHSVLVPKGRTLDLASPVALVAATQAGATAGMSTRDSQYGVVHARNWRVDEGAHTVTLTDSVAAAATTSLVLDPAWRLWVATADRRTVLFRHPSGRVLTVKGSAALRVLRGSTRPMGGWSFPEFGRAVVAPQILMDTPAGRSSVVLTMSGVPRG